MHEAMLLTHYETPFYIIDRYTVIEVGKEVTLQSGIIGYFTLFQGRRIFVPSHLVVINECSR